MTKLSGKSVPETTIGLSDRPSADFSHDQHADMTDLTATPPLITTAILAATAFRLRDNTGLIEAMRLLVRAVRPFESDRHDD